MNKPIAIILVLLTSLWSINNWAEEGTTTERTVVVEEGGVGDVLREIADEIKKGVTAEIEAETSGMVNEETTVRFEGDSHGISAGETLIAFTAIMMSLGMPILILLLVLIYSYRRRKQKLELVKTFLDANRDVPENILTEFDGESNNNLSSGIKITGLGVGIILAIYLLTDSYEVAALGLIPLFIGLSRLLLWRLEDSTASTDV